MGNENLTTVERKMREMDKHKKSTTPAAISEIKKKQAQSMFDKMVRLINQEVDLTGFKSQYFPDEDRTLEWIIAGMEDIDSGFVFEQGKVRTIKKLQDKPTCTFRCSEDTFLLLATGEMTYTQAYFWDLLQIEGEKALRDYEIFKRMFNKYGHLLNKIGPGA